MARRRRWLAADAVVDPRELVWTRSVPFVYDVGEGRARAGAAGRDNDDDVEDIGWIEELLLLLRLCDRRIVKRSWTLRLWLTERGRSCVAVAEGLAQGSSTGLCFAQTPSYPGPRWWHTDCSRHRSVLIGSSVGPAKNVPISMCVFYVFCRANT